MKLADKESVQDWHKIGIIETNLQVTCCERDPN